MVKMVRAGVTKRQDENQVSQKGLCRIRLTKWIDQHELEHVVSCDFRLETIAGRGPVTMDEEQALWDDCLHYMITVKPFNLAALKVGDFACKIFVGPFTLAN